MYAAVPRITPARVPSIVNVGEMDGLPTVRAGASSAFAKPKSSTFTWPSAVSFTFAGFRSRWMIPFSWAYSRASAICFAIGRVSSSAIARPPICSPSVGPSTSSITRARIPSDSSSP